MNLFGLWKALPAGPRKRLPPWRTLAIDPGETTGVAVFDQFKLTHCEQLNTSDMSFAPTVMQEWIHKWGRGRNKEGKVIPAQIVMEDYRVYGWKTEQHTWAALHTPRFIGGIEAICQLADPPYPFVKQMAQVAKGFCTDDKLKEWGYYDRAQRHSRDAIRHGTYYLLWPSNPPIKPTYKKG
jgi:hypothetical protein